jgi:carboxypeptidase C (cathepsin A)
MLPCLLVLPLLLLPPSLADDSSAKAPADTTAKAPAKDNLVETFHAIQLGGKKLAYQATAGTLVLRDDDGKPRANLFFVAYTHGDPAKRPITFTFNGGPGSSSVWLHMGAFGPRRVRLSEDGSALPPPYRLDDNDLSLLDLTDLVFIDPVTTGYSRPVPGQSSKQFHGVHEDVRAVGDFIRQYASKYERWGSPKFLAGESYGTTRAAALVAYLQDRHGMNFNGVVLISPVLNFQTIRFDDGNDLPYPLFLPTYTATAWYHKKLPDSLQKMPLRQVLDEAEQFALTDYNTALMKGSALPAVERQRAEARLARYTGLSEEYVRRANLRVDSTRFCKELLRGRGKSVGRFDARFTGIDADDVRERPDYDPSYAVIQGAYTATFNDYVKRGLKFASPLPYEVLTGKVHPWEFGPAKNRYLNVSGSLRSAMTKNPALKLFVANGYYDLATPYFATVYTVNHLGLDASLARHVTMTYYSAGHMMYIQRRDHQQLKKDLVAFYQSATR